MDLSIYICPMYQALYNESMMVLNNQFNTPECFGKADWNVTPPVLKFRFPMNESAISSCKNQFKVFITQALTTEARGTRGTLSIRFIRRSLAMAVKKILMQCGKSLILVHFYRIK